MPREISIFSIYMPTLLLLLPLIALVHWSLDGLLARSGFYQHVWHPSLFRLCSFICLYGLAGLLIYR